MKLLTLIAATTMVAAAPLMAQTSYPGTDSPTKTDPAHVAADAAEKPQTQSLNNEVDSNIAHTEVANAANQAQYYADKAAYIAAMREHRRDVAITDDVFIRQQAAYAQAMADWRVQTAACKRGHQRACDLPSPDPMNYM